MATAWTAIATFFITISVVVQRMEQNTQTQGQQHILHSSSQVEHSAPTVIGTREEENFDLNLTNGDDEDDFLSDQNRPQEERDKSKGNNRVPEDEDESSEDQFYDDHQNVAVDSFCDAFTNHYKEGYSQLILSLTDRQESFKSLVKKLGSRVNRGLRVLRPLIETRGKSAWLIFYHEISQYALYDPDSPAVSQLLEDIATKPVKKFDNFEKGTQVKLLVTLEDGATVLLKPMRFPREQETLPDHFYFNDYERHIAEIAAFHLDRIQHLFYFPLVSPSSLIFSQRVLGFYRVPPTVGRVFSINNDFNWFENTSFEENVYVSPAKNTCFYAECDMYCDSNHPICGSPDKFEASLQIMLPGEGKAKHEDEIHPWGRSYSKRMLAPWEHNDEYCDLIRKDKPYNEGRRLLDLMDVAVFDFLIGNMDRHDIDLFLRFGTDTSPILFDNGRGFGKSKEDTVSILAPIAQCCQIRLSTLTKLIKLYRGTEKLSNIMRTSLYADPLKSVLTEPHLKAFDRRLVAILEVVQGCVEKAGSFDNVVLDDGH